MPLFHPQLSTYELCSLCIFGLTGLALLILLLELALFFARHFPVGLAIFLNTLLTILWVVLTLFYWLAQSNGIWATSDPSYTQVCGDPVAFIASLNSTDESSYNSDDGYDDDPLTGYGGSNLTDPHGSLLTQVQNLCEGVRLSVAWFPLIIIILVLIFYLSILSCVTCSTNRTRRRWTKFVSRNPGYAAMEPPPPGASSVNIVELREREQGVPDVGGRLGEGETVVRDGVAYRWALMPVGEAGGASHGGTVGEDVQTVEWRRDEDVAHGASGSAQEVEGLVIGRAATPVRENLDRKGPVVNGDDGGGH